MPLYLNISMEPKTSHTAFGQLILDLTPRYGAGEARSIARIVFEDAFGTRQPDQKIFSAQEEALFQEIRRRLLSGEPLQYVLGRADFFGFKFQVSPAVLIPRQETEELVAWVLDWLKSTAIQHPVVFDIGLGSGCIAVALKAKRPGIRLFGLEKSQAAIELARENAERLLKHRDFNFITGDILERRDWARFPAPDVIVSNPPYIPVQEKNLLQANVLDHEPPLALFVDGNDPLLFYRTIASFAQEKLRPGGALFFECNEFNAPAVAEMLHTGGFVRVELRKDIAGADRMVLAIRSEGK